MHNLDLIKIALQNTLDNINAGACNMTEDQYDDLFETINRMTNPEFRYSKYKACEYLGISRATLDNYIREGKVNVRSGSEGGFKEKYFLKKDLDALKPLVEKHKKKGHEHNK